jgi:hypothetical protein
VGILTGIMRFLPRPGPHPLRGFAFWFTLIMHSLPASGFCETSLGEYSLKAAFIYNFSKFVEWPESAYRGKREFCIATLGRTPLDRELAALGGKVVQGRSIVFHKFNSPGDAAQCQILVISRSELARQEAILDTLRDLPVLTIADSADFCKKGGMLALEKENGKIVFDVNFREIQRAKLKANSQLLKLARRIYGRP